MRDSDFRGSYLPHADFRGANVKGVRFGDVELSNAKFDKGKGPDTAAERRVRAKRHRVAEQSESDEVSEEQAGPDDAE